MTHAEILAFEAAYPTPSPARDELIRTHLRISPIRYTVLLLRAAESSEGIAADPFTARRVRERRERSARRRELRSAS